MVSMVASVVDTAEAIRQLGGDAQAYVEVCQVFLQESLAWEADLPLLAAQAWLAAGREARARGRPEPRPR